MAYADEIEQGFTDVITAVGGSFTWKGNDYPCVINHFRHLVQTKKSYFPNAVYPKWGEIITVAGKDRQVTAMNGSVLVAASGGMYEDPPFTDDPNDPVLELTFDVMFKPQL